VPRFTPAIDGYFFPESPFAMYQAGKQAHVPLLAGWNSEEQGARGVLGREAPTRESFEKAVARLYPNDAKAVLAEYAPASDADVMRTATDLAGDRFIAYSTWKWIDVCAATGGKPVYRYYYSRPRPAMVNPPPNAQPATGAAHSAEIEYAMGNLDGNKVYAWTADERKVSALMQDYFANFIKTGNPNGSGLLKWPPVGEGSKEQYLRIDVNPKVETETRRGRYLLLDKLAAK
jgi:para-nitrobenzyl esterase